MATDMGRLHREPPELRYPARFFRAESGVGVEFPAIGGVGMATHGDSLEHARRMAREVVTGYLKICFREGEEPLTPPQRLPEGDEWDWVYPEVSVALAWRIRQLRESHGWSQQQVADQLNVSATTYKRWENPGQFNATVKTLEKLAGVLGRKLAVVLGPPVPTARIPVRPVQASRQQQKAKQKA